MCKNNKKYLKNEMENIALSYATEAEYLLAYLAEGARHDDETVAAIYGHIRDMRQHPNHIRPLRRLLDDLEALQETVLTVEIEMADAAISSALERHSSSLARSVLYRARVSSLLASLMEA